MLLQFVTEPNITPRDRRLIRSHVMRGKNAGRSRPARTPLKHQNLPCISLANKKDPEPQEMLELELKHTLSLDRLLWHELTIASFPDHVGPQTRRFMYRKLHLISKALYPPDFCSEVDLSHYAWLQYGLEDKAYFYTILAISSSFPTHFGGPRTISKEALTHISRAYRLTNERLSSPEACSDKAIAIVTMLAVFQRVHHQHAIGLVHFEGLKRMIKLRGGLEKLMQEHRVLAQKPWRLALEFALQDGSMPSFSLDEVSAVSITNTRPKPSPKPSFQTIPYLSPPLHSHFTAIQNLTYTLNTISTPFPSFHQPKKIDYLDYSDLISAHLHHLLAYAPLSPTHRQTAPLDDLVHLVLVAIMTTLMPEYGKGQSRYDLLAGMLRDAMKRMALGKSDEVMMWACFVGWATVLDEVDDEGWMVALARNVCERMDVESWEEVKRVLCGLGWICITYDKPGMRLWDRVSSSNNTT
ncbi:hypothetical protein EK21DRAFT_67800 [Setomelanomma holmii]|uniref:Uncharacterized protein n=1 Tax=Setomelanomma holmii TaxID=210430 RepID=A0A9P4LLP9_9PLEO|nr:hypothetical protein EK21DRAFT_67800 [Setomelanomma holmii]